MNKETFYFSHDYNTRSDPKIKMMLAKFGMIAYGLFWAIIEDLYNNANALPTQYDVIAYDLRSDEETIKSIINDFDLFEISGEYFGSLSVERRLSERSDKSDRARESALVRWNRDNANAMRTQCAPNAIKERKGKEIKGNIVKGETSSPSSVIIKRFIPPTVEQVKECIKEKGYKVDAEAFVAFYASKGWKIGTAPMKDWKMALVTWSKRDTPQIKHSPSNRVNDKWSR